jgi:hypothetical protein
MLWWLSSKELGLLKLKSANLLAGTYQKLVAHSTEQLAG